MNNASGTPAAAVYVVEAIDRESWNRYLEARGASIYLRTQWDDVFAQYGLRVTRLAAIADNQTVGVLPLVHQSSWLFGRRLVSLPWLDTAGLVSDDAQAREALLTEARARAARCGARVIELRQEAAIESWPEPETEKVLLRLKLPKAADELWRHFDAKVRNQVRKGEKLGLQVRSGAGEYAADFHRVYCENMRDLGSPSHSRRFFESVLSAFPREARIHVVRLGEETIGGALTLVHGDRIEVPWASSLRRFNSYCVNHALYWHLFRYACETGLAWFHFGRSTIHSGTYRFKRQWGAEVVPLAWYTIDASSGAFSRHAPVQEHYAAASRVWRRLPLMITRRLGPCIIARVP